MCEVGREIVVMKVGDNIVEGGKKLKAKRPKTNLGYEI